MSLLSAGKIEQLLQQNIVVGSRTSHINASSLDITLGNTILTELKSYRQAILDLSKRDPLVTSPIDISQTGYLLEPGEFILAQSHETFNLPNWLSAEYKLKSSMARIGLEHLNAGWCDAGWHGSVLTLELKNVTRHHSILLRAGDKIGQMIFFEHERVPEEYSYATKGTYNNHTTVKGAQREHD